MTKRRADVEHEQRSIAESNDNCVPPSQRDRGADAKANEQAFGPLDDAKLKNLRKRLRSLQYTEEKVSGRLRIWHISAITLPEYPVYMERLSQSFDALSVTISLFLLQSEVPRKDANGALGSDLVNDLLTLGLLTRADRRGIAAAVSIYPCCGSYLITDHRFRPVSRDYHIAPDQPVMHLGQDSYALAYLGVKPLKGGRVLDLCSGSGVHAVLAARRAEHVIGVDLNPRAVEFARFNAALNRVVSKCDFRCGHLYDAVGQAPGGRNQERFDLIVANPPFVPSPHTGPDPFFSRMPGPPVTRFSALFLPVCSST